MRLRRPARTGSTSTGETGGATAAPRAGGPPVLRLHLARRFAILALCNCLPIAGGIWLAWKWQRGEIRLMPGIDGGEVVATLVLVALSCLALLICWWVVLPIAHWLRVYPLWRLRHDGWVLWALPCAAGFLAWLALWALAMAAALSALAAMAVGVWQMARLSGWA